MKSRWKRKEVKTEQLITNSSLLRELKSVIGVREKNRAKLDFDNTFPATSQTHHHRVFSDTLPLDCRGTSRMTDMREQIQEEAFIDFKRSSTKAVTTQQTNSPRHTKSPPTPAYDLFLSNDSFMSRELAASSRL